LTSHREFESIEYLQWGTNKALNKRKEGFKERIQEILGTQINRGGEVE
jgi:hypothetical protein